MFALYLMVYVVRDHCIPDGNKRLAWSGMMFVLGRLGLTVEATDDEAVAMVLRVIQHESEAEDVAEWIGDQADSARHPIDDAA